MVWGEEAITNMLGFREHNRRLRDGPRRSYDVPLSDGRPGALIPLQGQRSGPSIMQCGTCRRPMTSCSHRNRGWNPHWRRRYGSPRPDGLPMGRDREQGYYLDDRPYTSPFYRRGRQQRQEHLDDDSSDDSDDYTDGYQTSDSRDRGMDRMYGPVMDLHRDEGRRRSYTRERERPQYPNHRSYNRGGHPSDYYARPNNSYDDGTMYGRGGRNRGHHAMYAPSESETTLTY